MRTIKSRIFLAAAILVATITVGQLPAAALGIPTGDFSLEVSPSPLVATVEPGKPSTIELKIRNASTKPEQLKIESRSFTIGSDAQAIQLSDTTPPDLAEWIRYSEPVFSVNPGAWYTQKITIDLPDSAGFSYPFAVVISRVDENATDTASGRLLKGSVAVFTLVNVDKPGATRKLELASFKTSQPVYEYLPVNLELELKNVGNSIVQPYGNFYIQRGSDTTDPLAVIPVNDNRTYLLPGTTKQMIAVWSDGFPLNQPSGTDTPTDPSHFRFGQYTAKVVAVYNDGTRDVPIVGEVTFWVIPWKILLVALVILIILGVGIWSIFRQITGKLRRTRRPE